MFKKTGFVRIHIENLASNCKWITTKSTVITLGLWQDLVFHIFICVYNDVVTVFSTLFFFFALNFHPVNRAVTFQPESISLVSLLYKSTRLAASCLMQLCKTRTLQPVGFFFNRMFDAELHHTRETQNITP